MKREEVRLGACMDTIMFEGFLNCKKTDSESIVEAYVLDMGDPISYLNEISASELDDKGAIFTFGGMLGEILLVFSSLTDFVRATPANHEFEFSEEDI